MTALRAIVKPETFNRRGSEDYAAFLPVARIAKQEVRPVRSPNHWSGGLKVDQ